MSTRKPTDDTRAQPRVRRRKPKDEPSQDWIPEWWENGGKQWMSASINGRNPGSFQVWIQGWREGHAEGLVTGGRRGILIQGSERFGPPDTLIQAKLDAIATIEGFELLADRIFHCKSWRELLAER